jgi:hypothetical protein
VAGDERLIVTFPSTYHALRAERVAKEAGVSVKMVPVPRQISADCNMGMEAAVDVEATLRALLPAKRVDCAFVRL